MKVNTNEKVFCQEERKENMAGSGFGTLFKIETWGESHGAALGVVVDGCPAGVELDEKWVQSYLDRRKPGQNRYATPRKEDDEVRILSGVFEGKTTGTPISMMVENKTQRSGDYSEIAGYYRPGHADYTFDEKYGFRDYRGGGRSSGRETIGRVAGGAAAQAILLQLGIKVRAYTRSIGGICIDPEKCDLDKIVESPLYMPDMEASLKAEDYLKDVMKNRDSSGGVVECRVDGLMPGIGEPVFNKLDACLSQGIMSIGAVKAVEIGDGTKVSVSRGSENNDCFNMQDGKISKMSNHSGGVLGGISDGSPVIIRASIKPTPSISAPQDTVTRRGEKISVSIKGRHDPVIVPRAVVVVESMTAITLVDLIFQNMTARIDGIKRFYNI